MSRDVIILGSTGSIGCSTLRVVNEHPDLFTVKGLVCHSNLTLLCEQLAQHSPQFCAVTSPLVVETAEFASLTEQFPKTTFFTGRGSAEELIATGADICLSAIVGAAGLLPTLAALKSCKRVALANKESLVMAGDIFFVEAKKYGTEVLPVDSEHSAIFALLDGVDHSMVDSIIITASGGSLRDYPLDKIASVTPEVALAHPTWSMGSKITIDSATLMNKGLEVIEAHHLFQIKYSNIRVVIHPESIIHSMVEKIDGSVYAHLGIADMAYPIAYAMLYPEMRKNSFEKLDLLKAGSLNFKAVDEQRFPALKLCYSAGEAGSGAATVLNAANETAVYAFLDGIMSYGDIVTTVDAALQKYGHSNGESLEAILEADGVTRDYVAEIIKKRVKRYRS